MTIFVFPSTFCTASSDCDVSLLQSCGSRVVENSSLVDTKVLITYVSSAESVSNMYFMKNVYTLHKLVFVDLSFALVHKRKEANV